MQYWQVGAGYGGESGGGRNYSDVFLDYGVMLIGPGEYGDYREQRPQLRAGKGRMREVIRFVEGVKVGDVVALKRPYGAVSGKSWPWAWSRVPMSGCQYSTMLKGGTFSMAGGSTG